LDSNQNPEIDVDATESAPPTQPPSLIKRTFRNRFGHWRAGWRLLVYFIAVFVIGKAISAPIKFFVPDAPDADFLSWTHTLVWVVGNLALLLEDLGRIAEAIERLQEAIPLFHDGLTHSAGGGTVDQYENKLRRLQS